MHESIESTPSGRQILKGLEAEGKYLFHGSPMDNIEELEPRQSQHVPDLTKSTEMIDDGDPAVSATPYADIAIFRSIINGKNIELEHSSTFGVTGDQTVFSVSSEEVLEEAKGKTGYVYVFNRGDFTPHRRYEWRSDQHAKPVQVVKVDFQDLLIDEIKIEENGGE